MASDIYSKLFLECDFLNLWVCVHDALCSLVPFVQYKKGEKHTKRGVTFSKNFIKSNTPPCSCLHRCFSSFSNWIIGSKSRKASHRVMTSNITLPAGTEANLEFCQTSMIIFWRKYLMALSLLLFCKKLHHRCQAGSLNTLVGV